MSVFWRPEAAVFFLVASLVCLGTAWTLRRRFGGMRGTTALVLSLLSAAVWNVAGAVKYLTDSPDLLLGLVRLEGALAAVPALLYFGFVSAFVGWDVHERDAVRFGAIVYVLLVLVLGVHNPGNLAWRTIEVTAEPIPHPDLQFGPLFLLLAPVAVGAVVAGAYGMVEYGIRSDVAVGRPYLLFGASTGVAVLLSLEYVLRVGIFPFDYTSIGVAVFAVATVVAIRDRFMDVVPVSRQVVLERISEGVVVLDSSEHVVDHNESVERLGFGGVEVGRRFHECLPEVAAEVDLDPDRDREAADHTSIVERTTGDDRRYVSVNVTRLDRDGTHLGWVLLFNDVTELKRYQSELERQNERLETFAGTVAHDLRNPLSVAQGYVAMVDDESDATERIADALDRMDAMIGDLLELARQGRTIGDTDAVDLASVARESWSDVDTRSARLYVPATRSVEADRDRLENLLENLFRNAVEHGGEGVTVTVDATDDRFYVADDGPGIPVEERDDVFDHGYTTADDGTGFGLSIVAEIAAAHGWTVEVTESETGGARFEFTDVRGPGDRRRVASAE